MWGLVFALYVFTISFVVGLKTPEQSISNLRDVPHHLHTTARRKPPMGFSSWNHFGMGVSAPLLLEVADAFTLTGLKDVGYVYINTDDGWLDKNRTGGGQIGSLHPASSFTNKTEGIKNIVDELNAKGYKFGIYLAAGETTCGNRAGTLYHEFEDASQLAAAGVDYLKYDDCGEANIQSYAKYYVMKDALSNAYKGTPSGEIDYYSFEPFQVYNPVAISEMSWTAEVGDLWRSGADIRPIWKSILNNAFANNRWASNGRPGHFNDADMLEVGNGDLTIAEQRSHFALWCLMKSPLIIGADVRSISESSLEILRNKRLIAVNQDDLAIQGTLRTTKNYLNSTKYKHNTDIIGMPQERQQLEQQKQPMQRYSKINMNNETAGSPIVGKCTFGVPPAKEQWKVVSLPNRSQGLRLMTKDDKLCLTVEDGSDVSVQPCTDEIAPSSERNFYQQQEGSPFILPNTSQIFYADMLNRTVSQIRDARNFNSCLAYDGNSLHMETCRIETGDGQNATDCWLHNCRFSSLTDQLFYLNSIGQVSLAFTNFQAPRGLPLRPNVATNIPMCLMTDGGKQPQPTTPPQPSSINQSLPLQIWAGPLAEGNIAVLLLNIGPDSAEVVASWEDIGLRSDMKVTVTDLWTGEVIGKGVNGQVSAVVGSHDSAFFRLSPENVTVT